MSESNEILSAGAQLIGMPLAGPESFSAEQLAYLKRALGVDETVLFEDTGTTGTLVASVVLSESSANFEKVEITLGWLGGGSSPVAGRLIFTCVPDGKYYGFGGYIGKDGSVHNVLGGISANGTTLALVNCLDLYTNNNSSISAQSFAGVLKVFKVVGIHRIAGGN
jgi:hypothetical protein